MNDRRKIIVALGACAVSMPYRSFSQQRPTKGFRIGVLVPGDAASTVHLIGAFKEALREQGYVAGQNLTLEPRYAEGRLERLSELAAEMTLSKADVIVAATDAAIAAAKQQTQAIPIVMVSSSDPVGTGFVGSLARPGGNVTGLSMVSSQLSAKRLGMLRELVPRLSRVAIIWNPNVRGALLDFKETESAARSLSVQLHSIELTRAEDLDRAFTTALDQRAQVLIVITPNPILFVNRNRIASLAQKNRLPSMFGQREYADAGGLIAYGPSTAELYRRAAVFVDKILKGAKPADLPVEQPTKFELVINRKTGRALGLTIPQSLLVSANTVID
jgi:putative ABC transport system substrate-binding protein